MNTRAELVQAFEDYQAGRLGSIPAAHATFGERRPEWTSRSSTTPRQHRFEIRVDGERAGLAVLPARRRDEIVFTHTEVEPQYEGKGAGQQARQRRPGRGEGRGAGDRRRSARSSPPTSSGIPSWRREQIQFGKNCPSSPVIRAATGVSRDARSLGSARRAVASVHRAGGELVGGFFQRSVRLVRLRVRGAPVRVELAARWSRSRAASHSSSVQPRDGWAILRPRPSLRAIRQTIASQPSRPSMSSAARWPSPRCSRRTVAACQIVPRVSAGQGRAALAAPRTRPYNSADAAASLSSSAASSSRRRSRPRREGAAGAFQPGDQGGVG